MSYPVVTLSQTLRVGDVVDILTVNLLQAITNNKDSRAYSHGKSALSNATSHIKICGNLYLPRIISISEGGREYSHGESVTPNT